MTKTTKNCQACSFCYYEPDADYPICGHPDSGTMGLFVGNGRGPDSPGGHCGPERTKFKQHPLRTPEGNLICRGSQKELGRD